ncbi:MAG: TRAP-type mannitol/chloroaromatic compound transport system permease large subunit [Paracoccaceae bacterium]|jgi:TRAP-type mannitol/chloroaromatic compound transport system permease large subunit
MELFFLALLVVTMAFALGSGYPVAFALPGSAILTIGMAALTGYVLEGSASAYFSQGGPGSWLNAGVTNLRGVYWEVERDTLIAIPLFIFMGIMLQRSKIAEDLLVTMARLFGPIPGGLGISVVFVGALLAATTGIVGATVVAMGLISLPAMLRNNYSQPLATGAIAASGTLGQIIPPSIVLIILADQLASAVDQAGTARKALHKIATGELSMPSEYAVTSTSAGEMFLGAFVPGMVLVALYMLYIMVFAILRPKSAPAVHYEGSWDLAFWGKVFVALVPPLALIFLVLGSIIAGVATVNQAGAIGAAGAIVMAGYRLREGEKYAYWPAILFLVSLVALATTLSVQPVNIKAINTSAESTAMIIAIGCTVGLLLSLVWSGIRVMRIENTLHGVMVETAKTTSLVFIILLGAAMLTAAFRSFGGEELVKNFLESLPGGFWTQFIIVMAVIFVLGFFLDFIEIAVVVVPIVAPILLADPEANITAVWLGVMIGLNIQTSFLTPPFGFALFYLRGVAPAIVTTINMYKGVIAFIALQLLALTIVGMNPWLVNYLPNRVSLTASTASPPSNPQLQYCLEEYVWGELQDNGDDVRGAIASAKGIDLGALPKSMAKGVSKAFVSAETALLRLAEVQDAEVVVDEASVAYRPVHSLVRKLEKDMRHHAEAVKAAATTLSRFREEDGAELRAELETIVAEGEIAIAALSVQMPADWKEVYEAFSKLDDVETKLRSTYRRATDAGYEPVAEALVVIDALDELKALETPLRAMRAAIETGELKALVEQVTDLRSLVSGVEGAGDIRGFVNKARSALRSNTPDPADAMVQMDAAVAAWEADVAWRSAAAVSVAPGLRTYTEAMRSTIGARSQLKMPRNIALYVASCRSGHRDISMHF